MARRAALFGCNYAGTSSALHGCINDVRAVHEMLVYAYQFDPQVSAKGSCTMFGIGLYACDAHCHAHMACWRLVAESRLAARAEHHRHDGRPGAAPHGSQHEGQQFAGMQMGQQSPPA